jgi:uncharacterized protein (TIGR03000 family)
VLFAEAPNPTKPIAMEVGPGEYGGFKPTRAANILATFLTPSLEVTPMKRLLGVLVAGVLATSALADNLYVGYAPPLAAYPAGGPPIVHPIYSYASGPGIYASNYYVPTYGYQAAVSPFYANRAWPYYGYGFGWSGFGYGYAGFGYDFAYGMSANPNIPINAYGFSTSYAYPYALGFDGTTPIAGFVAPAFQNELTTIARPYVDRGSAANSLNGAAKLTMTVPADAVVMIQGEKTDQSGTTRTFITPMLSGPSTYDVKVVHKVDGKDQEQTMTVTLHPNQQSSITVLR